MKPAPRVQLIDKTAPDELKRLGASNISNGIITESAVTVG